jgi:multidrug resistance protein, MATE family
VVGSNGMDLEPGSREASWWHRRCGGRDVLRLAMPLVLSSLSWTLLTFIDRMFLMWWSEDSLAASFPAALLWWTLLCGPLGICMYVGTFVSQYFGAGEYRRIGPVVWQGVWIGLIATPLTMLPMVFADSIFEWAGHADRVRAEEVVYFRILCLGTASMLVSHAFSTFYSGQGKTWVVMLIDIGSVALNIVLDYLWIFGHAGFPAMGIAGGGWATLVAVSFKVVVYLVLLARRANRRRFDALHWGWNGHLMGRLLRFGGPAGLQMLLEVAGFTAFVFLVGSLGLKELAATNSGVQCEFAGVHARVRALHRGGDSGGAATGSQSTRLGGPRHLDVPGTGPRLHGADFHVVSGEFPTCFCSVSFRVSWRGWGS